MKPEIIVEDITKVKATVIINSLGVGEGTKKYGGICASVTKASNSLELENKIKKAKHVYTIGEYFVTDGYDLPCDHIINLVTPFYEDDQDLAIYKDCIRRILNECAVRHFKRIAIPLIGIGANHYKHDDVKEIIYQLADGFMNSFAGYEVVVVEAPDEISRKNNERLEREMPPDFKRKDVAKDSKHDSKKYKALYSFSTSKQYDYNYFKYGTNKGERKDIIFTDGMNNVREYAEAYIYKRYQVADTSNPKYKYAHERLRAFLGYGKRNPKDEGGKALSGIVLESNIKKYFVVAFALKMSKNEAVHFLNYFGRSFPNPKFYEEISIVKELFDKKIYDLYEIKEKIDIFNS